MFLLLLSKNKIKTPIEEIETYVCTARPPIF